MTTRDNLPMQAPAPSQVLPSSAPAVAPAAPITVPLALLAAIGQELATRGIEAQAALKQAPGGPAAAALERVERRGLQLQELAHVLAMARTLAVERVDLGVALLQTLAEWSREASSRGAALHGPASSVEIEVNAAALKHLLDLLMDHLLRHARTITLELEAAEGTGLATLRATASGLHAEPETDALAWQLFLLLARSFGAAPLRECAGDVERIALAFRVA